TAPRCCARARPRPPGPTRSRPCPTRAPPAPGPARGPTPRTFLFAMLAGDRSLVDVVVHELAHSWTGNLVTNATMDHFWLNEGFTTWTERRILTALHGEDVGALAWAIGQQARDECGARFGIGGALTGL